MYRLTNLARVAALGAVLAFAVSCTQTRDVISAPPALTPNNAIFQSYVAIGNSITAGFQSNGINDSTQRTSYARLLATSMNTRYRYPSLAMPGCSAPIANTQTGAVVAPPAGVPALPCSGRTVAADTNEILNNVGVPGARVLDPTSVSTVASNTLTQIILKGKTQVQQALRASPTFASIWIGNNDVLSAAVTGFIVPTAATAPMNVASPGIVSTQAQFQTSYDAMITQLTAGAPSIKGVLIGVVQTAAIPLYQSGALIASNATIRAGINAAAGKTITVDANCTGSASLVSIPQLISKWRANTHPAVLSCSKGSDPANAFVGDVYVLDGAELTALNTAINGYNDYIRAKATAIGFAYYDPNVLLAAKRANQEIPAFPNLASTNATFGALISLDGVHPSSAAHLLIANELITAINAKYATTLPVAVAVP